MLDNLGRTFASHGKLVAQKYAIANKDVRHRKKPSSTPVSKLRSSQGNTYTCSHLTKADSEQNYLHHGFFECARDILSVGSSIIQSSAKTSYLRRFIEDFHVLALKIKNHEKLQTQTM